jgi:hypothetical protein
VRAPGWSGRRDAHLASLSFIGWHICVPRPAIRSARGGARSPATRLAHQRAPRKRLTSSPRNHDGGAMPGRRIGQHSVDLAGEFVSALPGSLRGYTDARRRRLQNRPATGMSSPYPRVAMLAMSSTSCPSAAIGCGPQGQGRRVLGGRAPRRQLGPKTGDVGGELFGEHVAISPLRGRALNGAAIATASGCAAASRSARRGTSAIDRRRGGRR